MEASKIRSGYKILLNDEPYTVIDYLLRPQSRGSAKVSIKCKHVFSGVVFEKTYFSDENIDMAEITYSDGVFLYKQDDNYYCMDNDTYEQIFFTTKQIEKYIPFLVEDLEITLVKWDDNPIDIQIPTEAKLRVIETEPNLPGNTASGGNKPATCETGLIVKVPFFIQQGDIIVVDTTSQQYKERLKKT
jgi:elongation factor P